ncbi:DUF4365 domain-containing protein [Massilia aquatica]|uniref:DUF4365 domain-containing protein n=1 Tax=Massilia aquatica TaxID=2609000 RepID=A0ABX0MAM9_9BURK|nr:DUF4365 domain-containing protein [Massilia aquatica]NHZ43673.1 DUF4365 domain-containing protein [Massilia aquatica]
MTEQQIKEAISREFVRLLAYGSGFKVIDPGLDHGVDLIICPVLRRVEPSGKGRFMDSRFKLEFQTKATGLSGIVDSADAIKFDLEVKNYNDLIYRRAGFPPLHLVLVIIDPAPPQCVTLNSGKLCLASTAYWFVPEVDAQASANRRRVRIAIPKTNKIGVGFIRDRFVQLGIAL